jgi:CheY-like chemotaxis protein
MPIETTERALRDALTHLNKPDYCPPPELYALTDCDPADGLLALQSALLRAIAALEPPANTPPNARRRQAYDLLRNRFVLGLTQEETAERMHMSLSTARRAQRAAIHGLARALWQRQHGQGPEPDEGQVANGKAPDNAADSDPVQAADWGAQAQRELAALRARSPDGVSDVGQLVHDVTAMMSGLEASHGVGISPTFLQTELKAAVHPSVLRQILVVLLERLARRVSAGDIAIYGVLEDGNVRITLTGTVERHSAIEEELLGGVVVPDDASLEATLEGQQLFLCITVPSMGRTTVLVVDDNPDMVRFYRRATDGTPYRIVEISQGELLSEAIETVEPDIVVLDVMLPDVDGWQLLMRLHEDPATRPIPVIVCSVVREEQLAYSLGARLSLTKPVRPDAFIQALDQVLHQVRGEDAIGSEQNGAVC